MGTYLQRLANAFSGLGERGERIRPRSIRAERLIYAFAYMFELLFYAGLRCGELLALTPADIDLDNGTVSITKTYHRIKGEDIITGPKTAKSRRTIVMPDFLTEELREYMGMLYKPKRTDRLFQTYKGTLARALEKYAALAGVKRIRIHDLRHSHVSLLLSMGYGAVEIADRVGHESVEITYRYAHLFPDAQSNMAAALDKLNKEGR